MRLDTYSFRNHLIEALEAGDSGAQIELDDGDVIRVRLSSHERVEIHIIEREVEIEEIRSIFAQNQALEDSTHTLYLLWCDMTLPDHGEVFEPEAWLLTLHTLYGQRVYGYRVYGYESYIYPVHLEWLSPVQRRAHYGAPVRIAALGCAINHVESAKLAGAWYIADFNDSSPSATYQRTYKTVDDRQRRQLPQPTHELQHYYALLGVEVTANRDTLKKAYRNLARLYHPDLNPEAGTHEKMQHINEAYRIISMWLDEVAV